MSGRQVLDALPGDEEDGMRGVRGRCALGERPRGGTRRRRCRARHIRRLPAALRGGGGADPAADRRPRPAARRPHAHGEGTGYSPGHQPHRGARRRQDPLGDRPRQRPEGPRPVCRGRREHARGHAVGRLFVPTNLDHIFMLFEFRRVQEAQASRLAAKRASPSELREIEAAVHTCRHGYARGDNAEFSGAMTRSTSASPPPRTTSSSSPRFAKPARFSARPAS